ncbi:PAC2 family protein [Rubrobacter tropicus]|uniref:PAC2 family protein n=1 Tax=Rubrobacter tropicus TaxID=2653851 RepID=A0A6G8Q852_9ACTN|nr:PAC2 family protein [Rubrobacter tropicus]QIN82612.1 PAC2 family protein [Rubrobacter tropicus]
MANRYVKLDRIPELERPILIAGFTGWNDAAEASSLAVGTLNDAWEARRFGAFDAEEFLDYQSTRPQIMLSDGVTRTIEWPENALSATAPSLDALGGRGAVLLSGPEPNFRWRTFCDAVAETAKELGAEMVITMGALLADVPHSRPVSVAANSQDPALVENLHLSASRYEGPTGITGVLHRVCAEAGLPSVSLWASVPHYLPAVPSAPAALALLQSLSVLLKMDVDTSELEETASSYQEQVSVAVSQDSDLSSYVQMLEERFDSQVEGGERNLPTGDDLAQELEGFLREQRHDEE